MHQRTGGNPFFLRTLLDDFFQQGVLQDVHGVWTLNGGLARVTAALPRAARALIAQQIQRLPSTAQDLLETASLVGATFAVESVAAGSGQASEDVAQRCARWALEGHFLDAAGIESWPDGTWTECYRFHHDLYTEVLAARLSAGRRLHRHRAIGLRLEAGYGTQAPTIAAELAWHFEQGQDVGRAMTYLRHAATTAAQRAAPTEAVAYLHRARTLLATLAPSSIRRQQELTLHVALGAALFATKGFGAPDVLQAYEHARALYHEDQITPEFFPVFHGLSTFYLMRGDFQTAETFMEAGLHMAQQCHDNDMALEAYCMLGAVRMFRGDHLQAIKYLTYAKEFYNDKIHRDHVLVYGLDPGVLAWSLASWTLQVQGRLDQAASCSRHVLNLGQTLMHIHSRGFAYMFAGWCALFRRDAVSAQALAESAITLGQAHGFPQIIAESLFIQGRALLAQGDTAEGVRCMREGLAAYQAVDAKLALPMIFALLADGYAALQWGAEGLKAVAEGLAWSTCTGESWWDAELYRLRGILILAQGDAQNQEAEACLQHALATARRQQAKLFELRAATSLAQLWQSQGKRQEAHNLLAPVYHWFTEGLETADLQAASMVLEA